MKLSRTSDCENGTQRRLKRRTRRSACRHRSGALAVEFALTFTVLMMFFFASIDFGRAMLIRHAINNAAFEGARAGIVPGASATTCRDRANDVLRAAMVRNATVEVIPGAIQDSTELIQVRVSADMQQNSWVVNSFFTGGASVLTRTSTIVRETY